LIKRIISTYRRKFWAPIKYAKYIGVSIGNDCMIATKYFGSEPYLISIGNHVQITNDVKFFTHGGGWVFREKYPDFDTFGKIVIKNNVYIGNNTLIMPGVTIGNNVIIGSGTVVTKSVNDGDIVAGNPGKVIGTTDVLELKLLPYNVNTKKHSVLQKKEILLNLSEDKFIKK